MVDRSRSIEVDLLALFEGQVVVRSIIVVDSDYRSIEMRCEGIRNRGFARSCSSSDSDDSN